MGKVATALGQPVRRAEGIWVREATGFAIGGVAPVGHLAPPLLLLDADLMALPEVWAAAGSPRHVFRTTPAELVRMTGARVADLREDA
jgi:prolyl-tRNA editing enzyme YbaK/EbsC (Cys-tRNA(Pro) deacylase)